MQRDVFNEKPSAEEQAQASILTSQRDTLAAESGGTIRRASEARIHTNMGDIVVQLFPEDCPKTVENFTTHSNNVNHLLIIKKVFLETFFKVLLHYEKI